MRPEPPGAHGIIQPRRHQHLRHRLFCEIRYSGGHGAELRLQGRKRSRCDYRGHGRGGGAEARVSAGEVLVRGGELPGIFFHLARQGGVSGHAALRVEMMWNENRGGLVYPRRNKAMHLFPLFPGLLARRRVDRLTLQPHHFTHTHTLVTNVSHVIFFLPHIPIIRVSIFSKRFRLGGISHPHDRLWLQRTRTRIRGGGGGADRGTRGNFL